jgi:hypothetical protein
MNLVASEFSAAEVKSLVMQGKKLVCPVCASLIKTVPEYWVAGLPLHGVECSSAQRHFMIHWEDTHALKEMRARMQARAQGRKESTLAVDEKTASTSILSSTIQELNLSAVKSAAEQLEIQLAKYAAIDADAELLRSGLVPLISKAKAGDIKTPMEWRKIPGSYFFNERNLRQYRDLEEAYAVFKIELNGGEIVVTEAMRPK